MIKVAVITAFIVLGSALLLGGRAAPQYTAQGGLASSRTKCMARNLLPRSSAAFVRDQLDTGARLDPTVAVIIAAIAGPERNLLIERVRSGDALDEIRRAADWRIGGRPGAQVLRGRHYVPPDLTQSPRMR